MVFWPLAEIFGIKYGIRNALKISNPLNTKYLVGCVAPPMIQSCSFHDYNLNFLGKLGSK
jgi:hypothetical protein